MNKDFKYYQEIRYCPVCKRDELFVSVTDIPHLSYCNYCRVVRDLGLTDQDNRNE